MDDQCQKLTAGPSEGRLTAVANAISSAINTDAVADSIFASLLKDDRSIYESSTEDTSTEDAPTEEDTSPVVEDTATQNVYLAGLLRSFAAETKGMEDKINLAVMAAVAELEHRPMGDIRALREQTLGTLPHHRHLSFSKTDPLTEHKVNINVVYDIFNSRPDSKLSALKFITTSHGLYFSAAVIRTQLDPKKSARPAIIIQADSCDSSDEALVKLYKFSQSVLNRAWELSEDHEAYFDIWDHLYLHDSGHWWDEGCEIGGPLV
jgi:hypothetical protein